MATIKSYTDLEQSKKLAEILPFESADMCYINGDVGKISIGELGNNVHDEDDIPCWSLAALLELIADKNCTWLGTDDVSAWRCVFNLGKGVHHETTEYDTPIDACVAMIEKLHELKML